MLPPESRVRFRLTAAQFHAIRLGLALIVDEHASWKSTKIFAHRYPRQLRHPKQDEAQYDVESMAEIEQANTQIASASGKTRRVSWNTVQIRAAMLATRVQADHLRFLRRERSAVERKRREGTLLSPPPDIPAVSKQDIRFAQDAATSISESLEKYLKRANRSLMKQVGRDEYQAVNRRWAQHVLWLRSYLVYFRPSPPASHPGRLRRLVVKEVAENIRLGLERLGRVPPTEAELKKHAGAALRAARRGRLNIPAIDLKKPLPFIQEFLGDWVIRRSHPKPFAVTQRNSSDDHDQSRPAVRTDAPAASDKRKQRKAVRITRPVRKVRKQRLAPHRKQQRLVLLQPGNRDRLLALRNSWTTLDLVEQADEVNSLLRLGCTQRGLADELGVAPTTIRCRVQIAHLSTEHRNAIKDGASAKAILKQMDAARIKRTLSGRFVRPEQRRELISELVSFLTHSIQNLKFSPRMYEKLKRPILESVERESKRLDAIRLPKAGKSFEEAFNASEPPPDDREEVGRWIQWIGTALARIEPDQALINAAVTETFAALIEERNTVERLRRNDENMRVLDQMKMAPGKTPSAPAPRVPTRTRWNPAY